MTLPRDPAVLAPSLGQFRIGEWTVDPADGTLRGNGKCVRLEPRVMDLLAYLASYPDRVVSKEDLISAVWGGSFVEEGALTQVIHTLRKVLGDDARQSRFIQTVPKRGYRLVAPVTSGQTQEVPGEPEVVKEPVSDSRDKPGINRRNGVILTFIAITLAGVVALGIAWKRPEATRYQEKEAARVLTSGIRIVVLPFENIGRPEDAFFADGLTEEITKDLASFPSLQVISRTSALQYRQVHKSLPEIGRDLGVDYVLEGTVRWDYGGGGPPRVRITPQLIRVADDTHVWAETFDRKIGDIFDLQVEIARRVVGSLGIALIPEEKRNLRGPPTDNLEAYRAYLRGRELENQPFYSEKHVQMAVAMFERAVELDPNFADAWAELSQAHSYIAFNSDESRERIEQARKALNRALALAPDLLSVRLAHIHFAYRCLKDFDSAYGQLIAAYQLFPNDSEVLQTLGFVLRRRGQLSLALAMLRRAFELDPRTVKLIWAIAETYRALRVFDRADYYYSQVIALAPDQPFFWEEKALNHLEQTGSLREARAILDGSPISNDPELTPAYFQLDFYSHEYKRALARLSPERMQALTLVEQSRLATLAVIARERLGDHRGALAAAEDNRMILESRVARYPEGSFFRAYLAVALAQLGREPEALVQIDQAVQQKRQDAFSGPRMVQVQALVNLILGRRKESLIIIKNLLGVPYKSSLCSVDLRLDPSWDALKNDQEFQALAGWSG